MSPNPPHTRYEIVNHRGNSFALTYYAQDTFFGREMVGSQVGLFQHVSSVRQRRFTQYSRGNRHANNTAASQTDPSGIRGEARRISSRTTILLRVRSTDT